MTIKTAKTVASSIAGAGLIALIAATPSIVRHVEQKERGAFQKRYETAREMTAAADRTVGVHGMNELIGLNNVALGKPYKLAIGCDPRNKPYIANLDRIDCATPDMDGPEPMLRTGDPNGLAHLVAADFKAYLSRLNPY